MNTVKAFIIAALVLIASIVSAETTCCPPCPACTPTLNCSEIPACPQCPSLTCSDNTTKVEGLWEVTTNKRLCGEIVLGPSWVIIGGETLMLNKVKKMVLVESCP